MDNVVQANLLAATTGTRTRSDRSTTWRWADRTTLLELFEGIRAQVARWRPEAAAARPVHREARAGDVRHSLADVSRARAAARVRAGGEARGRARPGGRVVPEKPGLRTVSHLGGLLFVDQTYPPDPASVGQHVADAAAEMARRGRVIV